MEFVNTVLVPLLIAIGYNLSGWFIKAGKDGEFEAYEWGQLGATMLEVTILTLATAYGLGGLGIDISALAATANAILLKYIMGKIKPSK